VKRNKKERKKREREKGKEPVSFPIDGEKQ